MTSGDKAPEEFSGRLAPGKDWREIVAWVGDLPPMPHVASRAISMVENPDTTAGELEELLSSDTALAARVLKIANSAMFSRQREITTLNQAIMLIGFKALKGIIVAATLRQLNKSTSKLETVVWQNSTGAAMFANLIAKKLRKRYVDEIFLLGLLHSLGQVVLLSQTSKEYKEVIKLIEEDQIDYATAEQDILGFAHPLIGALVAKKWNFSAETCQIILHYRDEIDQDAPESELEEKTALVQLADLLCHKAGIGTLEFYPEADDEIVMLMRYLGFTPDSIESELEDMIEKGKERNAGESGLYG